MEVEHECYQDRFASIRTGLAKEVDRGMVLVEELLKELDSVQHTLTQTKLDLDNECEARRRLQHEVQEGRGLAERQGRRPFVVALIDADADCYVFRDQFITRGEKGGEHAADALSAALQQYVRVLMEEPNGIDIQVRAFANFTGLGAALQRDGKLRDRDQFRAFAAGFSSRQAFFDFVDVGFGKERADFKVQAVRQRVSDFTSRVSSVKHLVLACGHDGGYAPWLGQFVGDKQVAERMTLVEGSPFPTKMRNLGLKTTQFSSVFNNVTQSAIVARPAWEQAVTSTVAEIAGERSSDPRGPTKTAAVELGGPAGQNLRAQSNRLGPMLTGQDGRRMDKPLHVDKAAADRIKRGSLCYYFYLRGKCVMNCPRNHVHRPLSNEEFDALWDQARQGRCSTSRKVDREGGDDCSDMMCIYGHGSEADKIV